MVNFFRKGLFDYFSIRCTKLGDKLIYAKGKKGSGSNYFADPNIIKRVLTPFFLFDRCYTGFRGGETWGEHYLCLCTDQEMPPVDSTGYIKRK